METPLVSICSLTYNHAPFIRQCLDGFLMQQCNFPIEIIINDDCSTDGTTEIIREYAEKYPDEIFPIFHEENLYSQGIRGFEQQFVFPKARGKYIALCEGDDYWTDPLKLQKQVDFLESHPDYSMCFHGALEIKEDGMSIESAHFDNLEEREYAREEIIKHWLVPTASALFRQDVLAHIPQNKRFTVGDNVVFITCSYHGKLYGMKENMCVYRRQSGGWSAQSTLKRKEQLIRHWLAVKESFPCDIHACINEIVAYRYMDCIWIRCREKEFSLALKCIYGASRHCFTQFYFIVCRMLFYQIKNLFH